MNKTRVLALSWAFPPMAFPRSIQVSRLLENMDIECKVICADDPTERHDDTIAPGIENRVNVIRLPDVKTNIKRYYDVIINRLNLPFNSNIPDMQRNWVLSSYRYYEKWHRENSWEPSVLITFGQPMSDHLFGLRWKKDTGIPWIAHFSDPWVDNIFRKDNFLTYYRNQQIERKVIGLADAVIFTSPETIDVVMSKYPEAWRQKAYYLPHSIDRNLYKQGIDPPSDCYIMRTIGNFYGARSPEPLFKGLEQIDSSMPELTKNLKIEIVGSVGMDMNVLLEKYKKIEHLIHFTGSVSYEQSICMMQTAHCLVVIDAPTESSVFFPSKLVDYIGANRYILAISPPGRTTKVVESLGGISVDPVNRDGICLALKEILLKRPINLPYSTAEYDAKTVGAEMKKIIDSII